MKTTKTLQPCVRLGNNHGYLIDGDVARIHADIEFADESQPPRDWALQLWACEAPHAGGPLSGVIVAEAALPVSGDIRYARRLDAETHARVPGGLRDFAMVLVLASGRNGQYEQVHDFANYPARQRFVTPHLDGSVGYHIDGELVTLSADAIRSPRDADNLSGSLSLELWAVAGLYNGGHVEGERLGHADLGRLAGQRDLMNVARQVPYTAAPPGRWQLVLMLREWTVLGYVTRDYARFRSPLVVATTTPHEQPVVDDAPRADEPPTAVVQTGIETSVDLDSATVSVNDASEAELASVKGMRKALAREIVRRRPYQSLDALLDVPGMGPKMLLKLRSSLRL